MKGVARKSSRQEPGLDSDWPPPPGPAAVCCGQTCAGQHLGCTTLQVYTGKSISVPQTLDLPRYLFCAAVFIPLQSPFAARFKLCKLSFV